MALTNPLKLRNGARAQPVDGPARVEALGVSHRYGDAVALYELDLEVQSGELLTLLGSSGSGKTTLLRILGGLITPTEGRVHIDRRDVTDLAPRHRQCGIVFQNYALFPHMSVYDNVAFPLRLRRLKKDEAHRRITEAIRLVDLEGYENRMPSQLSGGQQQRVSLARAVVFQPRVLLMDEPLGSLDKSLRDQLQRELRVLQQRLGTTTVYVTHDQDEAFALSDRVAVLSNGKLEQIDTGPNIYHSPATAFVAGFVGDLSRLHGTVTRCHDGAVSIETPAGVELHGRSNKSFTPGTSVMCGIRPENIDIAIAPGSGGPNHQGGIVSSITFQGSVFRVEVETSDGACLDIDIKELPAGVTTGSEVVASWKVDDVLLYPTAVTQPQEVIDREHALA